jgi:phosphoribosylaminoimidazole-succinocarboxamide synthase
VLTGLSAFWFARTAELVPNHLLSLRDDGRSMECRRLEMLPIECVVRGYLSGSGWKDYLATGRVCGHELPSGLVESQRLPEAIFTPATKATAGHDENIDRSVAVELIGSALYDQVETIALALYAFVSDHAAAHGIILADTKLEFGIDENDRLVLGDEAFTPDSSRFWPADEYEPGRTPPSFDKQFVRDYCESLGWDKTPPGPELPDGVILGTRARYAEAFERLTGIAFDSYLADPEVVLR